MTTEKELELTAEIVRLSEVAETLRDIAADLERDAMRSTKHGPEFDYVASFIAKLAKECEQYEEEFAKEAE